MAINIITQPLEYSPANNPLIFQIESNNPNVLYFAVKVLTVNDELISNLKYFVSPNYSNGTYFDLSNIISKYVTSTLLNNDNIIEITSDLFKYKLSITEKLKGNNVVSDGASITTNIYNVWNAELSFIEFDNYFGNQFVISPGSNIEWLTNKPSPSPVFDFTDEYLYFINGGYSGKVVFNFYNKEEILIGTHNVALPDTKGIYRLALSHDVLTVEFGDDFANAFGNEFSNIFSEQFGNDFAIGDASFYTVQIFGGNDIALSKARIYYFAQIECYKQSIEILFENKRGGYDTAIFFNLQENINITKNTIQKNNYQFGNGYSNQANNIFNPAIKTFNSTTKSNYTVSSPALNTEHSIWIGELLESKNVYIVIGGKYLPIQITNSSFSLKRNENNIYFLDLNFTGNPGLLKATG